MLSGFPKGTPSELGAHLASEKARMAEERGAIGVISIPTRASLKAVSWEKRKDYAGQPSLTWIGKDGKRYDAAPGIRLGASRNTPAAEALFSGATTPLSAVLDQAAKDGGKPQGIPLKPPVAFQRPTTTRQLASPKAVAML